MPRAWCALLAVWPLRRGNVRELGVGVPPNGHLRAAHDVAAPKGLGRVEAGRRAARQDRQLRARASRSRWGEGAPCVERHGRADVGERLNADMVGTRVEVRADPLVDRITVAPRHEGIDEAVALRLDVVIGETESLPVVRIVGQAEVVRERFARSVSGLFGVGLEDDALFDEELTTTDDLP